MSAAHRVETLVFELRHVSPRAATQSHALQERLMRFLRGNGHRHLEAVFDRFAGGSRVVTLERLVVDFGVLQGNASEQDWAKQLDAAVSNALAATLEAVKPFMASSTSRLERVNSVANRASAVPDTGWIPSVRHSKQYQLRCFIDYLAQSHRAWQVAFLGGGRLVGGDPPADQPPPDRHGRADHQDGGQALQQGPLATGRRPLKTGQLVQGVHVELLV